ncbi:hypothetical protein KI387_023375, partial [Taxus chinensis]
LRSQFDEVKLVQFRPVAPENLSPFENGLLVLSPVDSDELSLCRETSKRCIVACFSFERQLWMR